MTRRRFLLGTGFALLLLGMAALAIARIIANGGAAGPLEDALSEAKSMGLVTDLEEMVAALPGPNLRAEEAWARARAAPAFGALPEGIRPAEVVRGLRVRQHTDLRTAKIVMAAASDKIKLYKEAAALGPFVQEKKWSGPYSELFPELGDFRDAILLISARAVLCARLDDADGAIDDFESCLQIIKIMDAQPFLAGTTATASTLHSLSYTIAAATVGLQQNAEGLSKLQSVANQLNIDISPNVLGEELAGLRHATQEIRNSERPASSYMHRSGGVHDWYYVRGGGGAEEALAVYTVESACVWPDPEALTEVRRKLRATSAFLDPGMGLAKWLAPRFHRVAEQVLLASAACKVTRIGVAAVRLRQEAGAWPTLSEAADLAGVDPADPLSDDPLKFLVTGNRLVVHSAGVSLSSSDARTGRRSGYESYARFVVELQP